MSEIKDCDKKMSLPQISGTCWFNAILTVLFFSDGMRNYLKIVIEDLMKNVDTNQKITIKKKLGYMEILKLFSELIVMSELNDEVDFKSFYEDEAIPWYDIDQRVAIYANPSYKDKSIKMQIMKRPDHRKDKILNILILLNKYDSNVFFNNPQKHSEGEPSAPYIQAILNFLQIRDNVLFLDIDSSGKYKYSVLNIFDVKHTDESGDSFTLFPTEGYTLSKEKILRGEKFDHIPDSIISMFAKNIRKDSYWIDWELYNFYHLKLNFNEIEVVIIFDETYHTYTERIIKNQYLSEVNLLDQQTEQLLDANKGTNSETIKIPMRIVGDEKPDKAVFTADGCLLTNHNHAIAGITCNKKRYIFNGHTKVQKKDPKSNPRACYFQPFEWLKTSNKCFSIKDGCKIKDEFPKTIQEEEVCYNSSKRFTKIFVKSHHTSSSREDNRFKEILEEKTKRSLDPLSRVKNVGFRESLRAAFFGAGDNGLRIPKKRIKMKTIITKELKKEKELKKAKDLKKTKDLKKR
jgi:hypothetical protein